MKKKKKFIMIALVFLVLVLAVGIVFFVSLSKFQKELAALNYQEVNMETVEDGCYTGVCETSMVKATVVVTVSDHIITDIEITRHDNGKGEKAEVIVDDMVSQNKLDVDAISGATASSKVIKSAVRDALIQGINE